MMNIGLLPLDSRPCNSSFPVSLSSSIGAKCFVPPIEYMDYFLKGADCERLVLWLKQIAPACDALVIPFDMLAYGGLVAARQHRDNIETCSKRIDVLKDIKKAHPNIRIYASSNITRTSITVENEDSISLWENTNLYSKAVYLAQKTGLPEHIAEKARLEKEIPAEVLSNFLNARKRNAAINKKGVELVAEGVLDCLLLLQEDSEPYGVHRYEQEELHSLIEKCNLQGKAVIQNGADESGCLLIARAALGEHPAFSPVEVKYLNEENKNFTALYEDRPFAENLKSSMAFLHLKETSGARDVLFLHIPKTTQLDACMAQENPISPYTKEETEAFANQIAHEINNGKRVYLLDVVCSNGGDGDLLHALKTKVDLRALWGYAAWNTACNSMGTILGQLVFSQLSNKQNQLFTVERILDDYIYQSVVRRKLGKALSEIGQDVWNLSQHDLANEKLREIMDGCDEIKTLFQPVPAFYASLPWNRTFEVEILLN